MIKLQRLGHVLISVRDLEKSKDFYTRLLGFKVLEQDPDHGGLFLSIGGLGYYILYNSRSYRHNEAFVGVLLLAAFGVGFEVAVQWATRRFMPWYRRDEKAD